jgi:hypothetical protein
MGNHLGLHEDPTINRHCGLDRNFTAILIFVALDTKRTNEKTLGLEFLCHRVGVAR